MKAGVKCWPLGFGTRLYITRTPVCALGHLDFHLLLPPTIVRYRSSWNKRNTSQSAWIQDIESASEFDLWPPVFELSWFSSSYCLTDASNSRWFTRFGAGEDDWRVAVTELVNIKHIRHHGGHSFETTLIATSQFIRCDHLQHNNRHQWKSQTFSSTKRTANARRMDGLLNIWCWPFEKC